MKVVLKQLSSIPPRFLGGTKTAAKSTFCFELFIFTCVSYVLDTYLNNPCAWLSMSSLINPFLMPKTRRLLETKSKGNHVCVLQDSHESVGEINESVLRAECS